ncbi:uncharacterized protein TM35_000064980 [Trypanosoma theileri]|uniref:Uncharacterized protein n=1 Tax=Trypanosoma theileri TaxID=67003 RepID=A0A1X0P4A7_9TRYP|nr:uncharacterized protein TM35_000064980 [Trypanosoma theileri]ORC91493.1 hypothetical protein TM35_000064980 [Trypanosoma theileri]
MIRSWKLIDFCQHFGIDVPSLPSTEETLTAEVSFPQLAMRHNISPEAAANRLKMQNEMEIILHEEGVEDDKVVLDLLRAIPGTVTDSVEIRENVLRLLTNRQSFLGTEMSNDKDKDVENKLRVGTDMVEKLNVLPLEEKECSSEWLKKQISTEAALFSVAVDLARKEEEISEREKALDVKACALRDNEMELEKKFSAREKNIKVTEEELERRRTSMMIEQAKMEEKISFLEKMEVELKTRLNEVREAEGAVAAERVGLRADMAKLKVERDVLEQDRRKCNEVANGFLQREKRLREAEKKLSRVKDDLIACETLLLSQKSEVVRN